MKKIYIELSDICQLACGFCPAPKGVRGIMPLELFAHTLESTKPLSKRIALHILGDPCYVPNLSAYLALAKSHELEVELVTSGIFFHKHAPELLLSPPVYQLSISLESGVQNRIANYGARLAPMLAQHLQNPRCFLNLRIQRGGSESLYEQPSVLCALLGEILPRELFDSHSQYYHAALTHAIASGDMREIFDERGRIRLWSRAFLLAKPHFTWAGFAPYSTTIQSLESIPMSANTISHATSACISALKPLATSGRFCHALTQQIGVLSNGTIVPCCMDTQGAIDLGNIAHISLQEALQSHRAQAMIAGFVRGVGIEPLCQRCGFRD